MRQFYVPCPSITDSTPHLAPSSKSGAGPGTSSWSAEDGVTAGSIRPHEGQTGRQMCDCTSELTYCPNTWVVLALLRGSCPRRAHSLDEQIASSNQVDDHVLRGRGRPLEGRGGGGRGGGCLVARSPSTKHEDNTREAGVWGRAQCTPRQDRPSSAVAIWSWRSQDRQVPGSWFAPPSPVWMQPELVS